MSAHAFWATSGCQSLSLVGESVNHQMSTPPKRSATAPIFRQNGLTNTRAVADATARSPAKSLFTFPNRTSTHIAPNAQVTAMMAMRRTTSSPTQRMTRTKSLISGVPNNRGEEYGFRMNSMGLCVDLKDAMDLGDGFGIER